MEEENNIELTKVQALYTRKHVRRDLDRAKMGAVGNYSVKKWEMLYNLDGKLTELLKVLRKKE